MNNLFPLPSDEAMGRRMESFTRSVARVLVAVYVAGWVTGRAVAQASDALAAAWSMTWMGAVARLGMPGAALPPELASIPYRLPIVQRSAPATLPTLSRREACRRLRSQGLTPAAIGRQLGCSRTTVRRELAQ